MLDKKNIEIFSSRDKIRLQLLDFARNYMKLENFDFNKTSYLSYLIDIISILTSNLMYYNTSVYREQFLTKAVQRESVLALSRMIGYQAPLSKPAQVRVFMQIPLENLLLNEKIDIQIIGRNHIFEAGEAIDKPVHKVYAGPVVFSLTNSIVAHIENGQMPVVCEQLVYEDEQGLVHKGWKTVEARINTGRLEFFASFEQIEDVVDHFTIPILQPYEFYNIKYNFKKPGFLADVGVFSLTTSTNEVLEEWIRRDSLFLLSPNESSYTFRERDQGVLISFGNGILGKQPASNSVVVVTAGITQGVEGNVIAGSITTSDSISFLASNGTSNSFANRLQPRVINREPAINGEDPPSVDEIRSESIKAVSMNNRLVSVLDFKNLTTIAPNLPIQKFFDVMKRSDLKRNEITMFTDMIYDNFIVPTRNLYLPYIEVPNDDVIHQIPAGTIINEDPEDETSEEYITFLDILIDKKKKECKYFYYLDTIELPCTLIRTTDELMTQNKEQIIPTTFESSKILPVYANIYTDRNDPEDEELHIELYTNVLDSSNNYVAVVDIPMSSQTTSQLYVLNYRPPQNQSSGTGGQSAGVSRFTTQAVYDNTSVELYPEIPIPLKNVSEDSISIKFTLYELIDGTKFEELPTDQTGRMSYIQSNIYATPGNISKVKLINESKIDLYVKKDLSDFMYSQVVELNITGRDGFHSADLDKDYKISPQELQYVIDLYNAGSYHNDESSKTGYSPGVGPIGGVPHSADWRGGPDWKISLEELMDVIQIFNFGGYHTTIEGDLVDYNGFSLGLPEDISGVRAFTIYDVPAINKSYYDNLLDKVQFTKQVLQKITSFDIYEYKMMTDFVNLKFANTSGNSRNMRFNATTKADVYDINPTNLPSDVSSGVRFGVSDDNHPWLRYYKDHSGGDVNDLGAWTELQKWNRGGGFIATKVLYPDLSGIQRDGWLFETLKPNDRFKVTNPGTQIDSETLVYNDLVLYNGTDIVKPEFSIPLKLYVVAFSDPSATTTDEIIRQNIIDSIIDYCAPKFNYEASLYRSELIKVVQSVPGVRNCNIIYPRHDIFYDYDPLETMSQEELIKYTPELLYFGSENIQVEVRS